MNGISKIVRSVGLLLILEWCCTNGCEQIFIQDKTNSSMNGTVNVTRRALLVLTCSGSCQGTGYTPHLKWYTPTGELVSTFPGRIMSVYEDSRRNRKLYVQRFRWRDQGTYTCEGIIHGQFRNSSVKVLIEGPPTHQRWPRGSARDTALPVLPDANIQ